MAQAIKLTTKIAEKKAKVQGVSPLMGRARFLIWEKARGMWKNRKPDPIKELRKIRSEFERKLPKLH